MSDGNGTLPNGWAEAKIGDVTVRKVEQVNPEGPITYIDIGSVDNTTKRIEEPAQLTSCDKIPSRARQRVVAADVLVSMTRPNLNAVARVPADLDGAIGSTGFDVLRAIEIEPNWLFNTVTSKHFVDSMSAIVQGALYPAIRPGDVRSFDIPLPPLTEQRRIVAKIESLLERSSRAREALAEVGPLLEQFRQSVLQAAFSGRLTADWRKENPDIEPASELLKRIRAERRQKWEEAELAKYEAKGKNPPKNWRDKYKEPEPVDDSELPELPEGWCWMRGEQLFDWASGKNLPRKKMRDGDIPVFGGNGCSGYHDEPNVFEPTICIGRVGAHCGNVHITDGATWVTDNAIYATLYVPTVDLGFATFAFRSLDLNQRSRGGGQPYVNQDVLNDAVIALPPFEEQAKIVELLRATRTFKDQQSREIATARQELAQLDQSILAKAFRGELVPQDPSDEPASVLLERIRAARETAAAAKAAKKSARKKTTEKKTTRRKIKR